MYILNIILSSILFFSPVDNHDWKLRKDENGITIFTRRVEGSSFDEFKAIALIHHASLNKVLDIILDVSYYTSLIPDCTESRILFQKDKYYDIHYFRIRAPWPVKDRDAIYESETKITNEGKLAHTSLSPLGYYLEEKKDLIRMYRGTGYWELEEYPGEIVKITYQFHADPAGKIPAWLSNSAIVSNPFKTLENLKIMVSGSK
jgi:Polyketide cyclase / dehydrase and lipid transport